MREARQRFFGGLEVAPDLLHVVVVFKRFDQVHDHFGVAAGDGLHGEDVVEKVAMAVDAALLKDAGVDMTTDEPLDLTIKQMNRIMDEMETLLAKRK